MKRNLSTTSLLFLLTVATLFQSCGRCKECYYYTTVNSPDTSYYFVDNSSGQWIICGKDDIPGPTENYDSVTNTTYRTTVWCQ